MFNFVFDRDAGWAPYPNLAPPQDTSNGFHNMGNDWPFITPCRLLYFVKDHNYPHTVSYLDQSLPNNAYYPVGLGYFHYEIDYFERMTDQVHDYLREQRMRVLFYYHEGDNPHKEKIRLDTLCIKHNLPVDCYRFISGNTEADKITGFAYFPDHELFYWRNAVRWNGNSMPGCSFHTRQRDKKYTMLSRLHKWWRATITTELQRQGLLENCYWSYNNIDMGEPENANPIELYRFEGLKQDISTFLAKSPYTCDNQTSLEHNRHFNLVPEHYDNSYCNLVLETLYDAEQSNGAFISEKTFKPIRHAQPFIVFGTPNSLETLRQLGYRTFDHALDNSYDSELKNTDRFIKTLNTLSKLNATNLHDWYQSCKYDLLHNQELFLASKFNRIYDLTNKLSK